MSFVALGLEHSVANMCFFPLGWACGADLDAGGVAARLGAVSAGNLVGAAALARLLLTPEAAARLAARCVA